MEAKCIAFFHNIKEVSPCSLTGSTWNLCQFHDSLHRATEHQQGMCGAAGFNGLKLSSVVDQTGSAKGYQQLQFINQRTTHSPPLLCRLHVRASISLSSSPKSYAIFVTLCPLSQLGNRQDPWLSNIGLAFKASDNPWASRHGHHSEVASRNI